MNKLEKSYTGTLTKLLHQIDRLKEIKNGTLRPITLQIAPTDKCTLNCIFCSVKKREMKELEYNKLINALNDFIYLGIKSVDIIGGGDPTCYPHINEVISYLERRNIKIGLITNGIALENIWESNLRKLDWIRVSMNGLDYDKMPKLELIPKGITFGMSYVWNRLSKVETLDKINELKKKYHAKYVRVVPNCLKVLDIKNYRNKIKPIVETYENFFFQEKDYSKPDTCLMGYLKPLLNSDGYVYHCSANPLINRKFNPKFRMGKVEEVRKIWEKPVPFNTEFCGECFFRTQNELIQDLQMEIEHESFI